MLTDSTDPTHVVVTRRPSDSDASEGPGRLGVETLVVETAMDHASAVHVAIEEGALAEMVGEDRREAFERVVGDTQRLSAETEFRVPLPAERDAVLELLSLDPADTDRWHRRLFGIEEFAVVTPDSWLYRSVPHHDHIRELNADAAGALLPAVRDRLAAVPETGVFRAGPLEGWQTRDATWELWPDSLRRQTGTSSWHTDDLEDAKTFHRAPDRDELLVRWGRPESVTGRLSRALRESPPERIRVTGDATLTGVTSTLEELAATLGYEYQIR